ncbi:hypothetical protein [Pseudonocardia sp. MH-G8]|uniref:hypothetical protein n=1 Tax=Pseudonocardia sp. MH-G8 TaxID=1854588 RepID=UPI0018E97558|nr:hypothetical protein [Pseudonocardia sp. MH-G8]
MAPVPAPGRPRVAAFAATLTVAFVVAMAGTALAAEGFDCTDFDLQEEAQAVLDEDRSDPHRLDVGPDGPGDGVACEWLPHRGAADDAGDEDEGAPATTPATASEDDDDREPHSGTEGHRAAAFPQRGVATGGVPHP